jgi:glucose-1-phosphate adenylyltransferase
MEVPWEEVARFGVMAMDPQGRVVRFIEKSPERISNLANMGIYIFNTDVLVEELERAVPGGGYDFGANVIPGMLNRRNVQAYDFRGYWKDVGTLGSYWSANLDALAPETSGLDLAAWRPRTNLQGRRQVGHSPAWFGPRAQVHGSLVSRGCRVEGGVTASILSPGVVVGRGARVVGSVIMHDCVIEPGAVVSNCILDKDVVVGAGTTLGREHVTTGVNRQFPTHLSGGISVVGKGTRLPGGREIGVNVLIGADVGPDRFPGTEVPDGESVL